MSEPTPTEPEPALFSARILAAYLELIAERYPHVAVDELLESAGIPAYEVADPAHWLTQSQANAFHALAVTRTGNPEIAYEAGRFAASSRTFGYLRQWALGHLGLTRACLLVSRAAKRLTRSTDFVTRVLGPGDVEVIVTPRPGVHESRFQCRNRGGMLEGLGDLFLVDVTLDHPECVFEGAPHCRYRLRWRPPRRERLRRAAAWGGVVLVGAGVTAGLLLPGAQLPVVILGTALGLTAVSRAVAAVDNRALRRILVGMRVHADHALDLVSRDYDDALLFHDLGAALSGRRDPRLAPAAIAPAGGDIDHVLTEMLRVLQRRLDHERGLVLLHDPEQDLLVPRASYGFGPEYASVLAAVAVSSADRVDVLARSFTSRHATRVDLRPGRRVDEAAAAVPRALGARSALVCPLVYDDRPLGVLYVDHTAPERPLMKRDMNLLTGVAPTLAVRIQSALLADEKAEAERAATTDALTGMLNRRGLEAGLAQRWAERARTGVAMSALMLDIDLFKAVNDQHGHAVGDAVLVEIAALLARLHRGGDFVGRWGGEEFLVVLSGGDIEGTVHAAERVRAAVAAHRFEALDGGRITVSVGGAAAELGDVSSAAVVGRADAALYEAKRGGRDCAVVDGGDR